MPIITFNLWWMFHNILLALIPVYAGWLFTMTKNRVMQIVWGGIWLFFVPNTIYILTDLIHLPEQLMRVMPSEIPFLFLEYFFLEVAGVLCFLFAVYPIEKRFFHGSFKDIVLLNFVIAFGVTMGRFQRTNSWELVTDLSGVIYDIVRVMSTPRTVGFMLLFGLISNGVYFLFRDMVVHAFVTDIVKKRRRKA